MSLPVIYLISHCGRMAVAHEKVDHYLFIYLFFKRVATNPELASLRRTLIQQAGHLVNRASANWIWGIRVQPLAWS